MFPSPFRGLYLQIMSRMTATRLTDSFRPHSGDYISKYWIEYIEGICEEFPSPFRGLYLQIIKHTFILPDCFIRFPSPFRGLYLQIFRLASTCWWRRAPVSVPIPGTISPNLLTLKLRMLNQSFRPHSGDYISK